MFIKINGKKGDKPKKKKSIGAKKYIQKLRYRDICECAMIG